MNREKQALLDAALERVAEQLGDVVPSIMAEFLKHHPDAEASFAHHQPDNPDRLKTEMVANALYFVMTWFERRAEIEIIVDTSVDHHYHTLKVPAHWYSGLVEAAIDVLARTTPPEAAGEAAMWCELRGELSGVIRHAAAS